MNISLQNLFIIKNLYLSSKTNGIITSKTCLEHFDIKDCWYLCDTKGGKCKSDSCGMNGFCCSAVYTRNGDCSDRMVAGIKSNPNYITDAFPGAHVCVKGIILL